MLYYVTVLHRGGYKLYQTLTGKGFNVSIVELDSLDELKTLSREDVIARADRLYKVGNDYYSYFPSTGKLELVTTVKDYETASIELLDDMFGAINTDVTGDITANVENVSLFSNALAERQQYVQRELDNCNANLLLATNDTKLMTYKTQLETELKQLTEYQANASEQLQIVLACLGTDAADKILAEKISSILDQNFVNLVNQYNITQNSTDAEAVEKMIQVQNDTIKTLTEKYTEIEQILIDKRVALDTATGSLDNAQLQDIISGIDTRVNTYLEEYTKQVNELNIKVKALESIYNAVDGAAGADGVNGTNGTNGVDGVSSGATDATVAAIRQQYNNVLSEQKALQERIAYLEGLLGKSGSNGSNGTNGVDGTNGSNGSNDNDGVNGELERELANLKAQNEAINDLLNSTDLGNIEALAAEQERIQELISSLETTMQEADKLVSEEQLAALEGVNTTLQELISSTASTVSTESDEKLTAATETLTENINGLNESTKESLNALQEALNNLGEQSESSLNEAVSELQSNLEANIAEQEQRREDLNEAITALLESTADDLTKSINDLTEQTNAANEELQNELNSNIDEQNQKRTELDETLRALIESTTNTLQDEDAAIDEKLSALQDVYNIYVEKTDNTLTVVDNRLQIAENLLTTQGTDINGLHAITDELRGDLTDLRVDLATSAENLTQNISDKYVELSNAAAATTARVSELETAVQAMQGDISVLQTSVSTINTTLTSINTRLDALKNYTLPTASKTTLGGVKVDGDTISIDNNGVLHTSESINELLESLKSNGSGATDDTTGLTTVNLGDYKLIVGNTTVQLNTTCINSTSWDNEHYTMYYQVLQLSSPQWEMVFDDNITEIVYCSIIPDPIVGSGTSGGLTYSANITSVNYTIGDKYNANTRKYNKYLTYSVNCGNSTIMSAYGQTKGTSSSSSNSSSGYSEKISWFILCK